MVERFPPNKGRLKTNGKPRGPLARGVVQSSWFWRADRNVHQDATSLRLDWKGQPTHVSSPDSGGERNRKRAGSALHPRLGAASKEIHLSCRLLGTSSHADRVRTVRPCERSLYRRRSYGARSFRGGQRGNAVSGRDWRTPFGPASQIAPRSPGKRGQAHRLDRADSGQCEGN